MRLARADHGPGRGCSASRSRAPAGPPPAPDDARDVLTIGMSQFPSTLHPSIDSMLAKSYVLGLTQRPFTTYDQNWELVCLLCTELPTLENGKERRTSRPVSNAMPGHLSESADPALATKGWPSPMRSSRTPPGATARRSRPRCDVHLRGRQEREERRHGQ